MRRSLALVAALALAGCVGNFIDPRLDGPVAGPPGTDPSGDPTPAPSSACTADTVGRPLLRRLTAGEIDTVVRDALGLDASWSSPALPPDPAAANGFANAEDRLRVTESWLARMSEVASSAATAASEPARRAAIAPCAVSSPDRACAEATTRSLGRRLYRRALTADELARYAALYDRLGDFDAFLHGAVYAMLLSPSLLWRSELGAPQASGRALAGEEIASALSFGWLGGPPDEALLALAESGGLATPEGRMAAVRARVLDEQGSVRAEARARFLAFADDWLGVASLDTVDRSSASGFDEDVRTAMRDEIRAYVEAVVLDDRGDVAALLTSPFTVASPALAAYYGLSSGAPDAARVERPVGAGVGLLAQGAFLTVYARAASTSPTRRGHFVRSRLLCGSVPPPPPSVGPVPPPTPTATTRQRYEQQHASRADCAACHRLMDPIGFGLEGFDNAGRVRRTEAGTPIDDSGRIVALSGGEVDFVGEEELSRALAARPEVDACVVAFAASHSFGVSQTEARCFGASATATLAAGGSLLDAWIALAGAPHLATRSL